MEVRFFGRVAELVGEIAVQIGSVEDYAVLSVIKTSVASQKMPVAR